MVRNSRLLNNIPPNRRIVADGGFAGEATKIAIPFKKKEMNSVKLFLYNKRLYFLRWKIEAVFSRLKSFHILQKRYMHDINKHRMVFAASVAAYNVDVAFHPLS